MPRLKANGIEIEYESFGGERDPLVLLIMGLAAQLIFWPESLCAGLAAKGFRVVRFDNRDIGKSTHLASLPMPEFRAVMAEVMAGKTPAVPYRLEDMAKDAVGVLDALGVERAHFAGSSMGGMITQLVAINHPERVKSLVSMNSTTGRRDLPPGDPEAMKILGQPPKSSGREDLIEASVLVQRTLLGPGYRMTEAELRQSAERRTDRAPYDPAGTARQWAAVVAAPPRNAGLNMVRRPALVIHGDADPLFPVATAKDTAESIPGAELFVIPGLGHSWPESAAPVALARLGEFFSKAEARAPIGG
jgi:pimeloyl-ACP methyl ester carboxylesterase